MQSPQSTDQTESRFPWHDLVDPSQLTITNDFSHGLDILDRALSKNADAIAIHYFDGKLTFRQLDEQSNAIAQALMEHGFAPGERLALYMQNMPAFTIAMLATWKVGGSVVPINPMNKTRELAIILNDARPRCLVLETCLLACYDQLAEGDHRPTLLLTASPLDYQQRDDPRILPSRAVTAATGHLSWSQLTERVAPRPQMARQRSPDDAAFLMYTSGTTGLPKAAVLTHAATGRSSAYAKGSYALQDGETVIALAPVFHATGLMCTLMTAINLCSALVMTYRFHPEVALEAIREHRPTFTAASPTAYIALTQAQGASPADFACLRACAIGGAAVSPALASRLRDECGLPVQTGFGMTETGGAAAVAPLHLRDRTPVDPATGALSVGVPLPGVELWISGDAGEKLPPGEIGEIVIRAPTNMKEYWQRPEATAEALRYDGLRSGDVGFMDASGWFYLIDRKKDMIVASGFKVWPREVEDVLYGHPAVLEAAVVGVPDPYRGETVKAYVRLRSPGAASVADLQQFCRDNMASYKQPREFVIVEDLPKTASGKIQRAALR